MSSLNVLISPEMDAEDKLKKLQETYPSDVSVSEAILFAEYQLWRKN